MKLEEIAHLHKEALNNKVDCTDKLWLNTRVLAGMLAKLAEFEVTEEFTNRVHKLASQRMAECESFHGILIQAVIDQLREEVTL